MEEVRFTIPQSIVIIQCCTVTRGHFYCHRTSLYCLYIEPETICSPLIQGDGGENQGDGDMERVREELMAAQQTSPHLSSQLTLAQDKIQQLVSLVI